MLPYELPTTVYHVADARSWPSIQRHGLLTTAAILRRWQVNPDLAQGWLTHVRRQPVGPIEHPVWGTAWIRDQGRMTEAGLLTALNGSMSVADWCLMLNSQVFFFPSRRDAQILLGAYHDQPQVLLALNTTTLLRAYGNLTKLARINTGSTARKPSGRGSDTFLAVNSYAGTPSTIKEIVVRADIDDLDDHLTAVWSYRPGVAPVRVQ